MFPFLTVIKNRRKVGKGFEEFPWYMHKAPQGQPLFYPSNAICPKLVSWVNPSQMNKYKERFRGGHALQRTSCQIPQRVTNALMDEHLIKPTKAQSLIQSFLATLKRDMKILSQNSTTHEVTLEYLLFRRIISISDYHEVWEAYIRDKDKGES
jgi:hypothetical protein